MGTRQSSPLPSTTLDLTTLRDPSLYLRAWAECGYSSSNLWPSTAKRMTFLVHCQSLAMAILSLWELDLTTLMRTQIRVRPTSSHVVGVSGRNNSSLPIPEDRRARNLAAPQAGLVSDRQRRSVWA